VLHGMIVGAIAGAVAVVVIALVQPRRACPACGAKVPRFRAPASARQAMLGGWTCPRCGCRIDRKGRRVDPPPPAPPPPAPPPPG